MKRLHLWFLALASLLALSMAPHAYSQSFRYDGVVQTRGGQPASGATIAVCSEPANIATTPCSPLVALTTDITGTPPCSGVLLPPAPTPSQPCSNPMISDGLGNFHFYAPAGIYTIQYYGPSVTTYVMYDVTVASGGGGGGGGSGSPQLVYITGGGSTTYPCNSTGFNQAVAAAIALPNGTGEVHAEGCQGQPNPITSTITIGAINHPVRAFVSNGSTWQCQIINISSQCWKVEPNSTFEGIGPTDAPGGVGGLTLANTAVVNQEVLVADQGGANGGFAVRNLTLQGNLFATVNTAALELINPLQVGSADNMTIGPINNTTLFLVTQTAGNAAGPNQYTNNTIDCGGSATTGCWPVQEIAVTGGGVMLAQNWVGGVLAHPSPNTHTIFKATGVTGSDCAGINFYGTQFETFNAADVAVYESHCTSINLNGVSVSQGGPSAGFAVLEIGDCAGLSIQCSGVSSDGIFITALDNFNNITNDVVNTINGQIITAANTPRLNYSYITNSTYGNFFDSYFGFNAYIDKNGLTAPQVNTTNFSIGPPPSTTQYKLELNSNANNVDGNGQTDFEYFNSNAGSTAGVALTFGRDVADPTAAIKFGTSLANTCVGDISLFAGGVGSGTNACDGQLTVTPANVAIVDNFSVTGSVTFSNLTTGCVFSTAGLLSAISCTSVTLATNGTNNPSQNTLNQTTSTTNALGLTVTPIAGALGAVRNEVTGGTLAGTWNFASVTAMNFPPTANTTGLFYQTAQVGGTPVTQEGTVNYVASTNMTITPSIVGSVTTLTFSASTTGATAFSALTAATNSNTGNFIVSGGGWDFTAAAKLIAPVSAAYAPTASGSFGVNSTTNLWAFGQNGATITLPQTLAAVTHQFLTSYTATTGAFTQAAIVSGDVPNNSANTSGTAALATAPAGTPTVCNTAQPEYGVSPTAWNALCVTAVGATYGGTGANSSAATGVAYLTAGSWAFSNTLPVAVLGNTQSCADNTTKLSTDAFVLNCSLVNPMTTIGQMIGAGAAGAPSTIAVGLTGQVVTATNAATPSFASPGTADGNGGTPVTSGTYTFQCDSSTTLIDRAHLVRFQSGTAGITIPSSAASGCGANVVFGGIDDGAGALTVSRSGSDTITVCTGTTCTDSQTSFTVANGNFFTINNGVSTTWEARITTGGGGTGNTTSTSLTSCFLSKANGANSIINSSLCDNGTTTTTTEPFISGGSGTYAVITTNTANQNIEIYSGSGTLPNPGTGFVGFGYNGTTDQTTISTPTGLFTAYGGLTTSTATGALGLAPQMAWRTCTDATPCASSYTTLLTTSSTTLYVVDAALDCSSSVATATAQISIQYTDTSSTVQAYAPTAAVCTTLGVASVQNFSLPIVAQTGTNIQYKVIVANSPTYSARISIQQEGTN